MDKRQQYSIIDEEERQERGNKLHALTFPEGCGCKVCNQRLESEKEVANGQ